MNESKLWKFNVTLCSRIADIALVLDPIQYTKTLFITHFSDISINPT
jgi:hypothetical protein